MLKDIYKEIAKSDTLRLVVRTVGVAFLSGVGFVAGIDAYRALRDRSDPGEGEGQAPEGWDLGEEGASGASSARR